MENQNHKKGGSTPARRFNANHATRAALTLSAALLFGLGLRLGDAAIKTTMPQEAPQEAVQPQQEQAPKVKVVAPSKPKPATAEPLKAAPSPLLKTTMKPVAPRPVTPQPAQAVSVAPAAAPAPQERLVYVSERTHSDEGENDEWDDDEGEDEYQTVRPRATVSATPVRVVARSNVQPQMVQAVNRPRVVRRTVQTAPAHSVQPRVVQPRAQTRPQPRFVPQAPVRSRATTRGS